MALNFFKYKNMFSYAMAGFLPVIVINVSLLVLKNNLMTATTLAILACIGGVFIGRSMSRHPWLSALEGAGVWAMDIASPGFMVPHLCTMGNGKDIYLKTPSGYKRTLFNRAISFYLKLPGAGKYYKDTKGEFSPKDSIIIDKSTFTESNFSFMDQPVFLYNSKTGAFLTKEALGTLETKIMTEHLSLLELEQQRDLSKDIHALNRGVVDKFAPSGLMELIQNPFFIMIVVVVAIIIIMLFLAPQMDKIGAVASGAGGILPGNLLGGK